MDSGKRESAGYLANSMARHFAKALDRRLGDIPVTPGMVPALLALADRDGQTQAELVAGLGIEQATMARTLERMQRGGLVRRNPHKTDARKQVLRLTESARALLPEVSAAAQGVDASALAALDPAERDRFLEMMRKVIAALDDQGALRAISDND